MPWYFIKKGAIQDETVGPVIDANFLAEVRDGKHKPTTAVASNEVTGGKWYELQAVPSLKAALMLGQKKREEERERLRIEKQQEQERLAERLKKEVELQQQAAVIDAQQHEQQRNAIRFQAETQQVFDHYWMPEYLKVIWILNVVAGALIVLGWWGFWILAALLTRGAAGILGFIPCCAVTVLTLIELIVVRLILESFAIVFDIRGLLKSQQALLRAQNKAPQQNQTAS